MERIARLPATPRAEPTKFRSPPPTIALAPHRASHAQATARHLPGCTPGDDGATLPSRLRFGRETGLDPGGRRARSVARCQTGRSWPGHRGQAEVRPASASSCGIVLASRLRYRSLWPQQSSWQVSRHRRGHGACCDHDLFDRNFAAAALIGSRARRRAAVSNPDHRSAKRLEQLGRGPVRYSLPSATATAFWMLFPRKSFATTRPSGPISQIAGMPFTPYASGIFVLLQSPRNPCVHRRPFFLA